MQKLLRNLHLIGGKVMERKQKCKTFGDETQDKGYQGWTAGTDMGPSKKMRLSYRRTDLAGNHDLQVMIR